MMNKKREREGERENVKKVRDLPGLYYDYEKNRYFPIKNAHNKSYSDFLSNKNKTIVKNKLIEKSHETKIQQTKSYLKSSNEWNFSLFNMMKNLNQMNKSQILENTNLTKLKYNIEIENIFVKELKPKFRDNKYQMICVDNRNFLFTLDKTNEDSISRILIDTIILKKPDNSVESVQIREISLKYKERQFNTFKIVENLLILVSSFEIFVIRINELLSLDTLRTFYYNFYMDIPNKHQIPINFDFPDVKIVDYSKEKLKLAFLFYKSTIY